MNTPLHTSPIDLRLPDHSYMFGFIQADGHLSSDTRNRGKMRIELKVEDRHILEAFQQRIPVATKISTRTRNTNFKKCYESVCLSLYDEGYRTALKVLGVPYGRKSVSVAPPQEAYSVVDYYRGLVDADGSVGFTGQGFPFLTFCTKSPHLALGFLGFVKSVTGQTHKMIPNKRDKMYNLCITKEEAQQIARVLYYPGALSLDRKRVSAEAVVQWVRPEGMRRVTGRKPWTEQEDDVVLTHSESEAMQLLGRSESSIRNRYWRLTQTPGE